MNPVLAFAIVMLVWTVSDYVAKKTKSLLSSLFVASIIFFIGFLTDVFPEDLLASSSLLALAGVVVGFIIVHLGTMISLDDFKKQWRTLLVGIATVLGIGITLLIAGLVFGGGVRPGAYDGVAAARPLDFVIAGTGALSGGTISVLIVQEAALDVGLTSLAVFPVLIAALQGLIGFPLTSIILRREAARLKAEYRAGNLAPAGVVEDTATTTDTPATTEPQPPTPRHDTPTTSEVACPPPSRPHQARSSSSASSCSSPPSSTTSPTGSSTPSSSHSSSGSHSGRSGSSSHPYSPASTPSVS